MVGCIYIYIYLHILKTLRARFILFPLSDIGLKVPTSSFSGKSETPDTESDVWRGKSSRKETSMFDDWRSGDDRYVLSALQRLSDSNKFSSVPVSLPTSFHQIFALSIHIWQIFAILHSRKSATLCETRWAAAGSGAGAKAPRRPSLRKGCNAEKNRSKLSKTSSKLRGFVSLCVVYLYYITTCPRNCAGKQTSPGFHHLRIQQVEVSDTIGVKALRIWAQSLDSFLHLDISKLELKCKFKHSVFLSECIFRFGYMIWYVYICLIWYVRKGDDDICKNATTVMKLHPSGIIHG